MEYGATRTDGPPTAYAIASLARGEPGSLWRATKLTLQRTIFIAPGLYIAGVRNLRPLATYSLAASLSITVGLIFYYKLGLNNDTTRQLEGVRRLGKWN